MNELKSDEHKIIVDAIHDSSTIIHKGKEMNERIKELLDQSGLLNYTKIIVPEHKKFAELIIRECARVCEHRYSHNHKDNSEGAFEAIACSDAILEHFGVE